MPGIIAYHDQAVAALVASGKPMSSQEISNLSAFRGRLEASWDYVQAYAAKSSAPARIVTGTERVRENVDMRSRVAFVGPMLREHISRSETQRRPHDDHV